MDQASTSKNKQLGIDVDCFTPNCGDNMSVLRMCFPMKKRLQKAASHPLSAFAVQK